MTCENCARLAARILALEEDVRAYRAIVDRSDDERVTRLVSVALDLPPKAARLVAYLFRARRLPDAVPVQVIADALWPDSDAERPDSNVRSATKRVRDVLGAEAITTDGGRYSLSDDVAQRVARALTPELLAAPTSEPHA